MFCSNRTDRGLMTEQTDKKRRKEYNHISEHSSILEEIARESAKDEGWSETFLDKVMLNTSEETVGDAASLLLERTTGLWESGQPVSIVLW